MADFPSADFVARLGERMASVEVSPDLEFCLEQRIEDDPEATWHVWLSGGRVTVAEGPHPDPSVTLTSSRAVARAMRDGDLSAPRAFLDGDLRIGGDIAALFEHRAVLDVVAGLLAAT